MPIVEMADRPTGKRRAFDLHSLAVVHTVSSLSRRDIAG
jgi:hypothetical protein